MISFKVKKLAANAKLPVKGSMWDAGIDIFTNESYTLKSGETHMFGTGISVQIPNGYVALFWDRSGLGSKGIHRLAGVVDSTYRGEWKVVLTNLTKKKFAIAAGDKIVQCLIQKFEQVNIKEVKKLSDTSRGAKGFGSSGR